MATKLQEISPDSPGPNRHPIFAGYLLLGALPGLLGPLLILWHYDSDVSPRLLGLHALVVNVGCLLGMFTNRIKAGWLLLVCTLLFGAMGLAAPPVPEVVRLALLALGGVAVGAFAARIAAVITPALQTDPARIANACGAYFGAGALTATLLLDLVYATGLVPEGVALAALIPLGYLVFAWRRGLLSTLHTVPPRTRPRPQVNVRPLATSLLTMLVMLQFGNEWVLAVWLPYFLVRRFGASPATAISMLAIHFLFLVLGRWGARILLPIVNHRRLLLGSIALSTCAYLVLVNAHTVAGATTAIMLIGVALGPVLPITTENLQRDLPISSARRILLAAVLGAAVEPWLAGYFGENSGVAKIMIVPAVGAVAVCGIALLIMLESRLMGATDKAKESALLY